MQALCARPAQERNRYEHRTSRRLEQGARRRLHRRRRGRVHRRRPGEGRARGHRERPAGRPLGSRGRRRLGCHRHGQERRGAGASAPLHRARHGRRARRPLRRRAVRCGAGHRGRFLLRREARPRAVAGRLCRHRGPHGRDREGRRSLRAPRGHARRGSRSSWSSSPSCRRTPSSPRTPSASSPTCAAARTCPLPASWARSS